LGVVWLVCGKQGEEHMTTHITKTWFDGGKVVTQEIHESEVYKQEPVAWQYRDAKDDGTWSAWLGCDKRLAESTWREVRPLYTTPPAAQQEHDAYGYAKRLAVAIWEQHYKDVAPQWKPFDDLMGVLTQIDNMTAGLTAQRQPLTDEKINELRQQYGITSDGRGIKEFTKVRDFARAIESAHGITGEKK